MATQLRLRSAKILVINLGAVGTEVVKNLVLGGINSLEILDLSRVVEEDFLAQFFLPNDDSIVGQLKLPLTLERIRELNNRVNVTSNTTSWRDNTKDYFRQFDLIIATELHSRQELVLLNDLTRELAIPLYVTGLHGMFGYIVSDLLLHESESERDIGNQPRTVGTKIARTTTITNVSYNSATNKEKVAILDEYAKISSIFDSKNLPQQLNKRQLKRLSASLPIILSLFEIDRPENAEENLDITKLKVKLIELCQSLEIPTNVITDEYLELFSRQAFTEFSPIAAILGGTLAQDVIQFLSKKESPINNCLILDGIKSEMPIYSL